MKIIENINELARKAQKKMVVMVLASLGGLIVVGWFFMHSDSPKGKENTKQEVVKLDGAANIQFTEAASQKAFEEQQRQIQELQEQLNGVNTEMSGLQKVLDEKNAGEIDNTNDKNGVVEELQTRITELENTLNKKSDSHLNTDLANGVTARGITTTNFSYLSNVDSSQNPITGANVQSTGRVKTAKNYVPPGTFAKAVLLSGADTNAGVHGQSDTIPVTMRLLDNGTLPNGEHSSLKGCFVTAAAYGDASSERGQIRLQRLSCVRKPGSQILDIPIEGTINDMGGSDGVRGHVVMRNNKLIWNAGISGILSGFGSAMQQSFTTQATTPLGITNAVKSGKALEYGAFNGANTALGKLADYYIKLADMYHPVIQVHAGSEVNIVFLKGFSLSLATEETTEPTTSVEKTKDATNTQNGVPENLMQTIKDSQLGQGVDSNDSGEM